MKKVLSVAVGLFLVLALSACGGSSGSSSVSEFEEGPTKSELLGYAQIAFQGATGESGATFSISTSDYTIEKTGWRYVITGPVTYGNATHEAIIKLEFTEDYQEFELFQLKIDGQNIDL